MNKIWDEMIDSILLLSYTCLSHPIMGKDRFRELNGRLCAWLFVVFVSHASNTKRALHEKGYSKIWNSRVGCVLSGTFLGWPENFRF